MSAAHEAVRHAIRTALVLRFAQDDSIYGDAKMRSRRHVYLSQKYKRPGYGPGSSYIEKLSMDSAADSAGLS